MNEAQFLGRVAPLLGSYLEHVVVVGGFAVELFDYHPDMHASAQKVLTTRDLDLAAPDDLGVIDGRSMVDQLTAVGFAERLRGTDPPLSALEAPKDWGPGFDVELLVPLFGPRSRGPHRVHGMRAARLRYVDLLLHDPWLLTSELCSELPAGVAVRVVRPAAYLAQKLLSLGDRADPEKQRKDRAYCYSVVARAKDRAALGREVAACARARRAGSCLRRLAKRAHAEFAGPSTVGSRDAAKYLGLPGLTPARVADVMEAVLAGMGGTGQATAT